RTAEEAKIAEARRQAAETAWQKFQQARQRCRQQEADVARAEAAFLAVQEEYGRQERVHQESQGRLEAARQAEEQHARGREEIDDRRRLLDLAARRAQAEKALRHLERLHGEIARLNQEIQATAGPGKKE